MQWTPDRNAGFSTADPGKLYLPVIQSLVYHHNHVNVEAQMASGSSRLHWVRGMLSVRREHPVFGLGDFEVCESTHERVLAFVRVDRRERDTEDRSAVAVLCVNNLSSRPQSTTITRARGAVGLGDARPVRRQRLSRHRARRHDHRHPRVTRLLLARAGAAPR